MKRLLYDVGVNDADYAVKKWETTGYVDGKQKQKLVWICPFYETWKSMLTRCFCEKFKARQSTYKDVTCCEEWLLFSNFKRWMEKQDWEGKQLDKDILVPENKMYSPETCAFVSGITNNFVTASNAARGKYPLGVYWNTRDKKFAARCSNPFTKKQRFIGYFDCSKEAHEAWRKRKHELAQLVADSETDPRVIEALKKRYSIEEWYGKET